MDQIEDLKSLQDEIQAALIATTRTTGQIASEDLGFQRSLNPEIGPALNEQSERVLGLASALLKSAASVSELRAPVLQDAEDVDNNWRIVVDIVDSLLEKADTSLDEYTGVIKRRGPTVADATPPKPRKQPFALGNAFRTQNLVKPQLAFDIKPDNIDKSPWKPLLTAKPHAAQPLEDSLGIFTNDYHQQQYDYTNFLQLCLLPPIPSTPEGLSKSQRATFNKRRNNMKKSGSTRPTQVHDNTDNYFRYRHPYETEILRLQYPDSMYTKSDPLPYLPVETTSATFVDTEEGVLEMLEELKTATEIAVDLEHHDARSFVGLVSLMQISARDKDWIVDTLKPWRQKLQVLNEVFANPNIVKIFHGAYMDIVWLQRDLGLYVVGLFDTYWASRFLGYAGGSLAFLLKKFVDFDADKKYQMADWRIRPLPEEMFFYARADTHFLLYIYDNMRNELVDRTNPEIAEENLIEIVLQKSKETSLLRYEKQVYNTESGKGPGGWYALLAKTPALFNKEQFAVFRAIHGWRDQIARADDDSTAFVMPNHVIFSIAKLLPMDMVALLGIAHPISYSVKSRSGELLEVIKSAKAQGKHGPSMIDVLRPDSVGAAVKANLPAIAAQNTPPAMLSAEFDESKLRTEKSNFWGGAFGSSVWDSPKVANENDGMRLAVPLPALSSEVFADTAVSNGLANRSRAVEVALAPIPKQAPKKEPFAIKRGEKRKSDVISEAEEEAGGEYDISLNDIDSNDEARLKSEAKRQRKEEKKRRKAEERAAAEGAMAVDEEDDDEPFDYSKAESVLHGKREDGKGGKGGKGKKPFDPYQKSGDAAKGMRRVQSERAGRSHTFKS